MNRFSTDYCIESQKIYALSGRTETAKNLSEFFYAFLKRIIDIVFSAMILIVFGPLFLFIPILIVFTSPGPAIIKQQRVGKNGKIFYLYKFRSMKGNVGYAYSPTTENDKRITKVGRFLRKTGIDEIPQFINVIKGEMSIVGPRPEMEFIVKEYNDFEKRRLSIKPGITGLWQIKGNRKKLIHENIEYDLNYILNKSLMLDLAIMLETALFMIKNLKK